jgi:prophage DNA circulation protein
LGFPLKLGRRRIRGRSFASKNLPKVQLTANQKILKSTNEIKTKSNARGKTPSSMRKRSKQDVSSLAANPPVDSSQFSEKKVAAANPSDRKLVKDVNFNRDKNKFESSKQSKKDILRSEEKKLRQRNRQ